MNNKQYTNKIECENCGSKDWSINYMTSCDKCDSSRPKKGKISEYCKDNMHFHCYASFDGCDGCGCHEAHFKFYPLRESYLKKNNIIRYNHLLKL